MKIQWSNEVEVETIHSVQSFTMKLKTAQCPENRWSGEICCSTNCCVSKESQGSCSLLFLR